MRMVYATLWVSLLAAGAVLDRVAVVVGNDVITESELFEQLRLEEFQNSKPLDFSPAERRAAAERLVDQSLIRHEMELAQYRGADPKEADAMMQRLRQERHQTDAQFRVALAQYGITEQQLKQYLQWQLTALRFTDERFHSNLQQSGEQTANRADPSALGAPGPRANQSVAPVQSADRLASSAAPSAGEPGVDDQMNAWLKQARSSTRIVFKPEAFQ